MTGRREPNLNDVLRMLRKRMWWIIVPAIIGPVVSYGISRKLPNRYTSQTLVLVEQQKVPDAFVRPVVTEQLNQRLATMQEQILSRTRLQPIIERFNLFEESGSVSMEQKLDLMRRAIAVKPVRADFGGGSAGLPGFYISFTSSDPRLAQQVCGEITSMFMQENLRLRAQSAEGTTDFLSNQLAEAKRALDQQDKQMADFKRKNIGQLPGQEQANFNMLGSLNSQLDANAQALTRMHQDKTYLETILNQQLDFWRTTSRSNSPLTLQQQLEAAQQQLTALQSKYTDQHPDVIKMKGQIEYLQRKLTEENAKSGKDVQAQDTDLRDDKSKLLEPTSIQQLRGQIRALKLAIEEKTKEQDKLKLQIRAYEGKVQLSPVVEEQYKQITRDYQTALNFYTDLLTKKNQSAMATDLERKQQGEQFRVMDPPNLPEKPSYPDRELFAAGGLGAGLFLGLAIAVLLELRDTSIKSEMDVQFYLELPTLALMPSITGETNGNQRAHRWRRSKNNAAQEHKVIGA
jgi:polysaccharide chain length determinant protein (PEP-CTERM system associated)